MEYTEIFEKLICIFFSHPGLTINYATELGFVVQVDIDDGI
jgi:hypothetical protein